VTDSETERDGGSERGRRDSDRETGRREGNRATERRGGWGVERDYVCVCVRVCAERERENRKGPAVPAV
jgi:hypothetical protein